jgi:hypothetical protein
VLEIRNFIFIAEIMLLASPISSEHSSWREFDTFNAEEFDFYDLDDIFDEFIGDLNPNAIFSNSSSRSISGDYIVPIMKRSRIRISPPTVPRLLKRDIRRNYCTMFTNAMNGYDINLLRLFMTQYGSSNIEFTLRMKKERGKMSEIALCTPEIITAFWAINMQITPDQVFKIGDVGVTSTSGSRRSVAACTATINATLVLQADMRDLVTAMATKFGAQFLSDDTGYKHRIVGSRNSRIKGQVRGSQDYFDVAQFVASKLQGDANLHAPLAVSKSMRLKFVLDEEKRIERIIAETCIKQFLLFEVKSTYRTI